MNLRLATCATIAPYCVWMALLLTLPQTAPCYAVRTALTLLALAAWAFFTRPARPAWPRALGWGGLVGVLVGVLWILPEHWAFYRSLFVFGASGPAAPSPYDPAVCGWPLTLVRLAGSAFVIALAEELFFRSFLYRWLQNRAWTTVSPRAFDPNAFLWMVALFALEHDRWLAGAMAGALYGLVYLRKGLAAAVLAHMVTNLGLGLYVIWRGEWGFW